jgi:acetylornithine deacetylase
MKTLAAAVDANWDRQVAWLATIVGFPSLRGQEAPCQDWIAREFATRGWPVDRYTLSDVAINTLPGFSPVMDTDYSRAVQVVASLRAPKQERRSLIMQGHVDVVPTGPADMWQTPPFVATVQDGRMHGRGANDMKSGVCAMVFALDALRHAGLLPASDVYVQTVTEEESTGNGALSTLARGYRADACLIPEPTAAKILRGTVGVMWFRLRLRGRPVHVSESERGTNAILSAFGLIEALRGHTRELNERVKSHPWFSRIPNPIKFNPGKIAGGDWASSTPS